MVTCYERFEAANKDVCDVDKRCKVASKAQTKMEWPMKEGDEAVEEAAVAQEHVDQAMAQLGRARNGYRPQTTATAEFAPAGAVHCSGHGCTVVRDE